MRRIESRADMKPEKRPRFVIKEQKSQSKIIPTSALLTQGKPAKKLPDGQKL